MVQAAERAGVEHFVFFSALGASSHDRTRVPARQGAGRARRAARPTCATRSSRRRSSTRPATAFLTLLERLALLLPVDAAQRAAARRSTSRSGPRTSPTASCARSSARRRRRGDGHERFELAGPQTLSHREIVELVAARRRPRRGRSSASPTPVVCRGAARRRDADEVARAGDVGRGRAARGLDDHAATAPPTPRRSGVTPRRDGRGARRRPERRRQLAASAGRRSAHGCAASSCAASASSVALAGGAADELHGERQAVVARVERQRDRRLAGDVADRGERRELRRSGGTCRPRPGAPGRASPMRQRRLRERRRERSRRTAPPTSTIARANACSSSSASARLHRVDRRARAATATSSAAPCPPRAARGRRAAPRPRSATQTAGPKHAVKRSSIAGRRHGGCDLLDLVAERLEQRGGVARGARAVGIERRRRAAAERRERDPQPAGLARRASRANGSGGGGAHDASPGSGPASTSSSSAVSRTVRVSTPSCDEEALAGVGRQRDAPALRA